MRPDKPCHAARQVTYAEIPYPAATSEPPIERGGTQEPAGTGAARVAAYVTVAAVAVAAALVLGFLAGAASQSAPTLDRLPPPAATGPLPQVLLREAFTLPAANLSPSEAVTYNGYWSSAYVGHGFTYVWSAPFPVDGCVNASPGAAQNFSECSSLPGSTVWVNRTGGTGNFTVPSQPDNFDFFAVSPRGFPGTVTGQFWVSTPQGPTGMNYFGVPIPLGGVLPPYAYENLSTPFPAGYDALTIQGNASHTVYINFDVYLCCSGIPWAPLETSWNVTGYYSSAYVLNVTFEAVYPEPTNVNLVVVAFEV